MLKSFIHLTLYFFALTAAAQPQLRIDSVTVTGQYAHYTHRPGDVFSVTVQDWAGSYQKSYSAPIDASGKFSVRFPFPVASDLLLDWGRISEVNAAFPGETIRLYADLDEYQKGRKPFSTRFEGTNARAHMDIMQYKRDALKFPADKYFELGQRCKANLEFRDSLMVMLQQHLRMLNGYADKHQMDPRARQFLEADLRYAAAGALPIFFLKLGEQDKHFDSDGYFRSFDSLKARAQAGVFFTADYLNALRGIKIYAQVAAAKAKVKNADSLLNLLLKDPVDKELSLTWDVNTTLEASRTLDSETLQKFEANVKNPFLRSEIYARNNALIQLAQNDGLLGNTRLVTTIPELATAEEIMAYIASQYKGKVIYMDIWGTWCMPCREQMKYSPALKQRLKGKDVVFVYLANRSPETAWKNAIKQHGITGDNVVHYNLPAAQQSLIEKKYLYRGFPTYILISKEGKVVTNQAPRPGDPDEAVKAISALL